MLRMVGRVVLISSIVMSLGLPCRVGLAQSQPELRTPKAPPTPRYTGRSYMEQGLGIPSSTASLARAASCALFGSRASAFAHPRRYYRDHFWKRPACCRRSPGDVDGGELTRKYIVHSKLWWADQLVSRPRWMDGWYTLYAHPTDTDVRKAADAMLASGMADYGYQFIDLDDGWARKAWIVRSSAGRSGADPDGTIRPNGNFPHMASLTAYIHSLGFKAGIYSGPGPLTCAKLAASYGHEAADAEQYAKWGFDLLKYDWCSYTQVAKDRSLPAAAKTLHPDEFCIAKAGPGHRLEHVPVRDG